jgi:hypothetical protein
MAKKKTNYYKILVYILMILIVLGFTLPGFLEFGDENVNNVAPKICQGDSDCYLTCDGKPIKVLCSQNLCQKNSCKQKTYFEYQTSPTQINLKINLDNQDLKLTNLTTNKNIFAIFNKEKVQIYSDLSLSQILEKLNIKIDSSSCLILKNEKYCHGKVKVNSNEIYAFNNYKPKNNDKIEMIFTSVA